MVNPEVDLAMLYIKGFENKETDITLDENVLITNTSQVYIHGYPFGMPYTITEGIVSSTSQPMGSRHYLQTDAAVNPGNSGGPLLNLDGEVVGINSQIFTHSGGSIGLSFAVPAGVAIDVVSQLKSKGRVDRGWLGVYVQEVDKSLARSSGLTKTQGALVVQVEAGSPADVAGIHAGDIVLYFDNEEIIESGDLPHVVGLLSPGSQIKAQLIRGKKKKTLDVIVGTLPDGLSP